MKKLLKTLGLLGATALTAASLTACGGSSETEIRLTVAVTQDTGTTFQATKAWMDAAATEMGFTWDYVLASTRDNASNLTALQNALLNGTNGIISMVDLDETNLSALLKDLEANDAYYAGFETELANARNAGLLDNERIVGTSTDGEGGASRGETLFDEVVKTTDRKIVFGQYPANYFPNVVGAVDAFIAKAEEYNKTHDDDFTFYTSDGANYVNDGTTYKFNFGATLADAEYEAWDAADVDAVVAVNSVAKLILPATVSDSTPIHVYSVGFDDETKTQLGGTTLKTLSQTPSESIFYSVVMLINAINGKTYSDQPTAAADKVATAHYIYLTSQDELAKAAEKVMNFSETHDLDHCLITPAEAKKLLAGQSGASYAKLTETLDSWTADKLFA